MDMFSILAVLLAIDATFHLISILPSLGGVKLDYLVGGIIYVIMAVLLVLNMEEVIYASIVINTLGAVGQSLSYSKTVKFRPAILVLGIIGIDVTIASLSLFSVLV